MSPKARFHLKEAGIAVALWTALLYLYWFVAFFGTSGFDTTPSGINSYLHSPLIHLELVLEGMLLGLFYAAISRLTGRDRLRRRPLYQLVLIKAVLDLLALVAVGLLVAAVFEVTHLMPAISDSERRALTSPAFIGSVLLWLLFCTLVVSMVLEMRRKLGPHVMNSLLLGHYYKPRNEERVFLFMDLKDSTHITETLGHQTYSRFLRECYAELTELILRHQAEVYQYVGDEVVMSWPSSADNVGHCVELCLKFQKRLVSRAPHYTQTFGVAPTFRAGADIGTVTVTEVGEVKTEIAYHGDVLNTAARLLSACKDVGVLFLISDSLQKQLPPEVPTTAVGELDLRGKDQPVAGFSVG